MSCKPKANKNWSWEEKMGWVGERFKSTKWRFTNLKLREICENEWSNRWLWEKNNRSLEIT